MFVCSTTCIFMFVFGLLFILLQTILHNLFLKVQIPEFKIKSSRKEICFIGEILTSLFLFYNMFKKTSKQNSKTFTTNDNKSCWVVLIRKSLWIFVFFFDIKIVYSTIYYFDVVFLNNIFKCSINNKLWWSIYSLPYISYIYAFFAHLMFFNQKLNEKDKYMWNFMILLIRFHMTHKRSI